MTRAPWPLSLRYWTILCALLALASTVSAQPTFQKSFNPATIGPGSVSTLRFAITNSASLPVRGLTFVDSLPAGVVIATPANAKSTCLGTLSAPDGGGTLTFTDGGIGGSTSCSISVDVTSSLAGTHTNVSGDLTSEAGNSGPATADLTVATDRPGFTKSFAPSSISFGGRSTLTLTIDNSASSGAASGLTFIDNLPTGMEVASPPNAATDCSGGTITASPGGSAISYGPSFFGDASVAAGASCRVTVDVIGNAVGLLGNTTGELTSRVGFGSSRSSGKASATLTVTIDQLSLTKRFTDDPAAPGGTVTLEFTLRNLDRSFTATQLAFTDDLDAALSGLVAVGLPLADACGPGSVLGGTSVLSLIGGSLDPEGTCTFSVTLQVPAAAPSGVFTNTTSQVTGDIDGRTAIGSPATDLLFISPAPRLTKSFLDDPVGGGGTVTLEFTITNTSPTSNASEIAFQDTFDTILPTASATPAAGFCGAGSTATFFPLQNPSGTGGIPARLLISGASLAAGETCTFGITLDVAVGAPVGIYPNITSEISATVDGETVSGNPASDNLEVVGVPRLVKVFTDDPVVPGGTVTLEFTLTHDENSPGDASGITFSDDLTATLPGLTATGLPASDVCGLGSQISGTTNLLFTGGSLMPGESCTFAVTLDVPSTASAGGHTNTTSSVVATVAGVTATENGGTDDLDIAGLTLSKEFLDDPVRPGGTVTLRFTIDNINPVSSASDIAFVDDLGETLSNLMATGLPLSDICGAGSSLSGSSGNTVLVFRAGSLVPGESCSFDVTLEVPAGASANTYVNRTENFSATIDATRLFFDNAADTLTVVSDFLEITKEFINDPVAPGGTVTLRFVLTNMDALQAAAGIEFTDDLDAALNGLVSASGTLSDICGVGSQITGTDVLSFTGGSLAAGGSCTFDVVLSIPATVELGTLAANTTSQVTGTIGGLPVTGDPAMDDLRVDFVTFTKAFDGSAIPGGTVGLTFTIHNLDTNEGIQDLSFSDDLGSVIPGLSAIGLPVPGVCGEGSALGGTTLLTLSRGNLLPDGSCTFSVNLQVPASASAGSFLNTTSELLQSNLHVAGPATDTLTVIVVTDEDGDGVLDGADACPGTVIPEGVPTESLGTNRYALVDGDRIFDTTPPKGKGPAEVFTVSDTGGCSCEQIIEALDLGNGHTKFGCSLGAMREWVSLVSSKTLSLRSVRVSSRP